MRGAGLAFGLWVSSALACGYCVEDRIAAVYDHAVLTQALKRQHHMAFFAIVGTPATGARTRRALEVIAESATAVDKGSARVSIETATLALAFDPQRTTVPVIQQAIERQLAGKHLTLQLLRKIDQNGQMSTEPEN